GHPGDLTDARGAGAGTVSLVRRTIEVSGPASVSEAWERYAVISAWHTWSPPIRSVEATAPRIAPGVTGIVRGVAGAFVTFRIESVDERAHTWAWTVGVGPLTARLEHGVRLAEGDFGSVTTLTVDAVAPIALGYPEVARLSLHRLVAPQA
ncbi:MAG: SRPBCC family protein, partial [Actinomycetota bacterium]|nr:SRPBCC family protein [Actinomycetota bacterium]